MIKIILKVIIDMQKHWMHFKSINKHWNYCKRKNNLNYNNLKILLRLRLNKRKKRMNKSRRRINKRNHK